MFRKGNIISKLVEVCTNFSLISQVSKISTNTFMNDMSGINSRGVNDKMRKEHDKFFKSKDKLMSFLNLEYQIVFKLNFKRVD